MEKKLHISVYRYNPDTDEKPYMQDFEVDPKDCRGVMVLDAIEAIKLQDPSLAIRRSCGEGVCGSDGINVNGKNMLACVTQLSLFPGKITIRPLPGFPVVRDLVVDMSDFYDQYERMQPYLQNDTPAPKTERLQTPEQRAQLDGLYECILCACCTSSCPSYWWNMNREAGDFAGPAALLWSCRFTLDSRDTNKSHRVQKLQDAFSLFRCRSIMNCIDVCPKGLNPTRAIGKLKHEMMKEAE